MVFKKLANYMLLVRAYARGFLMFGGSIEIDQCYEIGSEVSLPWSYIIISIIRGVSFVIFKYFLKIISLDWYVLVLSHFETISTIQFFLVYISIYLPWFFYELVSIQDFHKNFIYICMSIFLFYSLFLLSIWLLFFFFIYSFIIYCHINLGSNVPTDEE